MLIPVARFILQQQILDLVEVNRGGMPRLSIVIAVVVGGQGC